MSRLPACLAFFCSLVLLTVLARPGVTSTSAIVRNPANGHYYCRIDTTMRWWEARDAAASLFFRGERGYLATLTSPQESDFVLNNLAILQQVGRSYWLGGYQDFGASNYSEPGGGWRWITGEPWDWTNWSSGEPNNGGDAEVYGNEQYLHFGPGWNDIGSVWNEYVVEFNPESVKPTCNFVARGFAAGPARTYIEVSARDLESGLCQISVDSVVNCSVSLPSFSQGTTSPATVYAYKVDQGQRASVTLRITDCENNTTTCAFTINDAPVARDDTFQADEDSPLAVTAPGILANDSDVEGNALALNLLSSPAHGSLSLNPNGSFNYTPFLNYNGTDNFTYRLNDGLDGSNIATVTVNVVNVPPSATPNSFFGYQQCPLRVAPPGVLHNDTDADGDSLTALLVQPPTNGLVELNDDGSFTYISDSGATTDSFTYRAYDGTDESEVTTVTLTLAADMTKPTCSAGGVVTGSDAGGAFLYLPVTAGDSGSGVRSVQLTANSRNCELVDPETGQRVGIGDSLQFDPARASTVVRAYKSNLSQQARVELRVTDCTGNYVVCDPVIENLELKKKQISRTFKNIPQHEHYLSLQNGTPGLTEVKIWVNGKRVYRGSLLDGQALKLDLHPRMRKGNKNTLRLLATGPMGATAVLLIGDAALAGGAAEPGGMPHGRKSTLRIAP